MKNSYRKFNISERKECCQMVFQNIHRSIARYCVKGITCVGGSMYECAGVEVEERVVTSPLCGGEARGVRSRVWCTCAADRVVSRWPYTPAGLALCRSPHTVPFTSRTNGHPPVPVFATTRISFLSLFRVIYVSTLWTPTLLVHHLLSQSSRLTRRIDMRQPRDVVSTIKYLTWLEFFQYTLLPRISQVTCILCIICLSLREWIERSLDRQT